MPNPFSKRRTKDTPYAIFQGQGFTTLVLKTYQMPEKEEANPHARWFVAVKSPFTFDSYEMGDQYISSVSGTLTHATQEFIDTIGIRYRNPLNVVVIGK
jgi:hypothetical protein